MAACAVVLVCMVAQAGLLGGIAAGDDTGVVVVGVDVPSAVSLDVDGCRTNPASLNFGSLSPGQAAVTEADCVVTFGSTGESAYLVAQQSDEAGRAMQRAFTPELDESFGVNGVQSLAAGMEIEVLDVLDHGAVRYYVGWATSDGTNRDPFVAAINASSGTPFTLFSGDGLWSAELTPGATDEQFNAVMYGSAGIIVTGRSGGRVVTMYLSVFGLPYTTFGPGGMRFEDLPGTTDAEGVTIDSGNQNSIIVGARRGAPHHDTVLVIYPYDYGTSSWTAGTQVIGEVPGGTLGATAQVGNHIRVLGTNDGTSVTLSKRSGDDLPIDDFGDDGTLVIPPSLAGPAVTSLTVRHLEVFGVGDVLVAGDARTATSGGYFVAMVSYDGELVTSFAGDGVAYVPHPSSDATLTAFSRRRDGGVVLAGMDPTATPRELHLHEFNADGTPAPGMHTTPLSLPTASGTRGRIAMLETGPDGALTTHGSEDDAVRIARAANATIPDYVPEDDRWTDPSSPGLFGACVRELSNGAEAIPGTWSEDAGNDCAPTDDDAWNPIRTGRYADEPRSTVAWTDSNTLGATVALRFGLRPASDQPEGLYVAPLRFMVLSPGSYWESINPDMPEVS